MNTLKLLPTIILFVTFLFTKVTGITAQTHVSVNTLPEKQYPLELWVYNIDSDKYEFGENLHLSETGKVEFDIPDKPNLYKISLHGKGVEFINDGDQTIEITIDMKSKTFPPIIVKGSEATNYYKAYLLKVTELQNKYLYPLEPKMKAAIKSKDQKRIDAVEKEHQTNLKIFTETLAEQITAMGSSLAVYAIVRTLDFNKYLSYIEILEKTFSKNRPTSPFTFKIIQMVQKAKMIQVGEMAPEFEINTSAHSGRQKLSDFKGNVVLVDFWASWCLPCIKENIEFKDIYSNFNAKGFDIWAISLDKKETAWKKSIKKYQLPWLHSRLTDDSVENMYNVVSLPTNFLIDENGIIIARNITASQLLEIMKNR